MYDKYERQRQHTLIRLTNMSKFINNNIAKCFKSWFPPTQYDGKEPFKMLYKDQIEKCAKVRIKTNTVAKTDHAMYRFTERFESHWYTMLQVETDLKKRWRNIKLLPSGKLQVRWKLWTYIIVKEWLTIITMYPNKPLSLTNEKC